MNAGGVFWNWKGPTPQYCAFRERYLVLAFNILPLVPVVHVCRILHKDQGHIKETCLVAKSGLLSREKNDRPSAPKSRFFPLRPG